MVATKLVFLVGSAEKIGSLGSSAFVHSLALEGAPGRERPGMEPFLVNYLPKTEAGFPVLLVPNPGWGEAGCPLPQFLDDMCQNYRRKDPRQGACRGLGNPSF